MRALRKKFFVAQVSQLFQIRRRPKVELAARVSTFIMPDQHYSRCILTISPVGNCPRFSPPGASAPTRNGNLETEHIAKSQVKSQVK
jgi:hypothetical protein